LTTVGGSVFYAAATGTTETFVDVNLNGDDDDDRDDEAAATQDGAGAGGTGGGVSSGGAGDNAGGDGNAGGGVRDGAGAGAGDEVSNYGELTTVVKDSGFGHGTPTHSGMASRLTQAVRKGAVRFSEEAIELKTSEYFLSLIYFRSFTSNY
jgi:hypothetical protein